MPELGEVEYYRKQWDPGVCGKVVAITLHANSRIFRGTDVTAMRKFLPGSTLKASEARGKHIAFRFSGGIWIAIHLGMTGKLRTDHSDFHTAKHDHFVIRQSKLVLVFSDPRQFGRVRYFKGAGEPAWWSELPPSLISREFSRATLERALRRHARLPVKSLLLMQAHFPGVGNWMADEILWRARIDPKSVAQEIPRPAITLLYKSIRFVCSIALKHIAKKCTDLPASWLFHQRWGKSGMCPRDKVKLKREPIGGRTTVWCAQCQE